MALPATGVPLILRVAVAPKTSRAVAAPLDTVSWVSCLVTSTQARVAEET